MGLPTNSNKAKQQGCVPTSSNCVVWQGPDLPCIGLCKGDTVSDVIEKLATELCTLITMFDLETYDLACLSIPVSETPTDIGELIQILTDRICALEGIDPVTPSSSGTDCPDNCIVSIAPCFYYLDETGDSVTTMTLQDYVTAIGNRICTIIDDITILQNEVQALQDSLLGIDARVGDVETDKASISSLQYQVNSNTSASAGTKYLPDALRYIEDYTLLLGSALGTSTEVYQAILTAGLISRSNKMYGTGIMSSISGWIVDPQNAAATINNLWLTCIDLREQVEYMKENCCSTGCSSIWLNFRAALTGPTNVTIYTDGSTGFTNDWSECTGQSTIFIKDSLGNSTSFKTSLLAITGVPTGYTVSVAGTGIEPTADLTVTVEACFINKAGGNETTCTETYETEIINSAVCPSGLVITAYNTSVNYQFSATPSYSYIVNVYYLGGSSPVASQIVATPGTIVIQSIPSLLELTDYELEIIVVDALGNETSCPKEAFTTLGTNCQPPINAVAILTTP